MSAGSITIQFLYNIHYIKYEIFSLIVRSCLYEYRIINQSKYICISFFSNMIQISSFLIRFFEKKDNPFNIGTLFICRNIGIRQ